jgi:hypothetical protein
MSQRAKEVQNRISTGVENVTTNEPTLTLLPAARGSRPAIGFVFSNSFSNPDLGSYRSYRKIYTSDVKPGDYRSLKPRWVRFFKSLRRSRVGFVFSSRFAGPELGSYRKDQCQPRNPVDVRPQEQVQAVWVRFFKSAYCAEIGFVSRRQVEICFI